ncbi:hypothetical protein D3C80_1962130 [compost metagenome]
MTICSVMAAMTFCTVERATIKLSATKSNPNWLASTMARTPSMVKLAWTPCSVAEVMTSCTGEVMTISSLAILT